jgi:membrane-bound lytic murein transglycosylase D
MKWFKLTFSLGNVIAVTKCSLAYFGLLVVSLTTMSFTDPLNKRAIGDSTVSSDKSGLKSLFNNKVEETTSLNVQLNPQAVSFVQEYIRKQGEELNKMRIWGKPFFDLYDRILGTYSIPKEMKYLSVIESHLTPRLVSWAGAAGPWQIMPDEARRFGLRTGAVDERMDFSKSTHAAARLMKELYGVFGDWLLVVAAYNGGAGRVKQAIRQSGSKDFWDLQYYLPEETRNHVKKFIGTHYAFEGIGGWTTMTAEETQIQKAASANATDIQLSTDEIDNSILVEVSGRYSSSVITNSLQIDIDKFYKWNPGFEKILGEGKKYSMRLLKDKAVVFEARKNDLLMESVKALLEGTTVSR